MKNRKKLLNQFRWSFSRDACFQECKRKYWYTYYGSWEGWPKTPFDTREAIDPLAAYLYTKKQMQTLPAFVGSVVHAIIESALKKKMMGFELPAEETLVQEGLKRFQNGIQDAKEEKWKVHPKKHTSLFEWYYQETPPSAEEIGHLEEKVITLLHNWYLSPIREKLLSHPQANCRGVEELIEFKVDGLFPALAIIDCIVEWKHQEDAQKSRFLLFDWKTGAEKEEILQQLTAYALAIQTAWNTPLQAITIIPFYIAQGPQGYVKYGEGQKTAIQQTQIEAVKEQIRTGCKEMMPHHVDSGAPPLENFPCTQDKTRCRYCPFLEICSATDFKNLQATELQHRVVQLGAANSRKYF